MQGVITLWNNLKGFGFVTAVPDGRQYFFHISNFVKENGEPPVLEGQVRFDIGPALSVGKRPQALRVQYMHSVRNEAVISALASGQKVEGSEVQS